jgi:hypothetical protein
MNFGYYFRFQVSILPFPQSNLRFRCSISSPKYKLSLSPVNLTLFLEEHSLSQVELSPSLLSYQLRWSISFLIELCPSLIKPYIALSLLCWRLIRQQALTSHLSLVNLFRQRVVHRETLCIIRNSVFVVPAMLPKMISASTLKNFSPPKDLLRIRLKDSQVHEFFF